MNLITSLLLMLAAAGTVSAKDGFMGHYGYLLSVPDGYQVNPEFKGAAESVLFFPAACKSLDFEGCGKIGLVELTVLPKWMVKESGINSFEQYIKAVRDGLAKAKTKITPVLTRGKAAGFPSAKIYMRGSPESLNAMIMAEGSKVYYRVKFREKVSEKTAEALLASLKEVQPTDVPPAEQGRQAGTSIPNSLASKTAGWES